MIQVSPDWAPLGAERFLGMVQGGFFDTRVALFRVVKNFLVQFGVAGTPEMNREWLPSITGSLADDPHLDLGTFERGMISFAGSGPNSRTTQMFIAFKDSQGLGGAPWETPFGKVVEGMEVVDQFYDSYGDLQVFGGNAPSGDKIRRQGVGPWLLENWPELDFIESCRVQQSAAVQVPEETQAPAELAILDASDSHHAIKKPLDQAPEQQGDSHLGFGGWLMVLAGACLLVGFLFRKQIRAARSKPSIHVV